MQFEIGKYYKHTTGYHMLHVLVEIDTTVYGRTKLAEIVGIGNERLVAVGDNESDAANYVEANEEEWMKKFIDY